MQDAEIRQAEFNDIGRILDLLSQVLEVHARLRPDLFVSGTTKYNEDDLKEMLKDPSKPIYVAVVDNEVVGYAMCQIKLPTSNMYPNRVLHLDDLCVDERFRRQALARLYSIK